MLMSAHGLTNLLFYLEIETLQSGPQQMEMER